MKKLQNIHSVILTRRAAIAKIEGEEAEAQLLKTMHMLGDHGYDTLDIIREVHKGYERAEEIYCFLRGNATVFAS